MHLVGESKNSLPISRSYFFLFKLQYFLHSCSNPRKNHVHSFLTKKVSMAQIFLKHFMHMSFLLKYAYFPKHFFGGFLIFVSDLNLGFEFPLPVHTWLCSLLLFQLPDYFLYPFCCFYFCYFFMGGIVYNINRYIFLF